MRRVLDIGLTVGVQSAINRCYRLIWGLAMKLKILLFACILMLPLGLTNAQNENAQPPGHNPVLERGQGHVRHEGVGNGHRKFDVTQS